MVLIFRRAINKLRKKRLLSIVTVAIFTLLIFFISALLLCFINVNGIMDSWKKGIRLIAYLSADSENLNSLEMERQLLEVYGVNSVKFISKEDGLSILKKSMPGDLAIFRILKENPLPDTFEIQVLASSADLEKLKSLAENIEKLTFVVNVEYGQECLVRFARLFYFLGITGYIFVSIFFAGGVSVVANFIRLLFNADQQEIEIMRLVGATDGFINTPFYILGVIYGALCSTIALLLVFMVYLFFSATLFDGLTTTFFPIKFFNFRFLSIIVLCSIFAGLLGCFLSINALKKK